jgi:ribonucleoside-triphosphate reductase (thioredoxin)
MDNVYSDWLCIPRSIKVTSVKPSGTVSLLPGVSAGIHYHESKFYIRRVVIDNKSQLVKIMKDAGYVVEKYIYDPDNAMVVEFPVKVENFFKGSSEVTMWEQLLNAADYQKFWADNQVSITVRFHENEKKDIANALSIFDTKLKAVSMLPYEGHGYDQAPYEAISEEQYEKRAKHLKRPDYSSFIEVPIGEKGCDGDTCQLPKR